ncbi:MAG TPA: cytochrome c oxidase subunit 3 [Terriglobales bacterium]|nr:cytochrome c oxidase subunit 3 [Terriglobales bacterium]
MASFTPTIRTPHPTTSRGKRADLPPVVGGGDGGRPDPGSPDYGARLRRARLGLAVALTPITMLFVAFTSAYIVRQGLPTFDPHTNTVVHDWIPVPLPTRLFLVNTCVLLLSSVSIEYARRQLARQVALEPVQSIPGVSLGTERNFPWLALTLVLGLCFLLGQWLAWSDLASRGFYVATGPSSSFVYLLTGAHAVHLFGGILALLVAGAAVVLNRPLAARRIVVDVTAWYWHFMALLWIYILALLEFAH